MPKRPRDDEDDFDVVDEEERPKKKKRPSVKETRSTRVDETDEVEERPRRRRRDEDDAEEEDRPTRRREEAVDDDDDDRPRKKKKPRLTKADRKRMREEDEEAREKARENLIFEWTGPIALTFCGVLMTVIAGFIMARRTEGIINPPLLLAVTTGWTIILIPIVIVSLMVIGSLAAIDYGTLKNAVRSLVAITFFVNGIYWLGNLTILGWFLAPLIAGIVTFALFMMFFGLDPQETSTSLGVLNVILWVANKVFLFVVLAALMKWGGKDRGDDPPGGDERPAWKQKGEFNNKGGQPPNQFGDDGDDN